MEQSLFAGMQRQALICFGRLNVMLILMLQAEHMLHWEPAHIALVAIMMLVAIGRVA